MLAAIEGNKEMVSVLLKHKAKPNVMDLDGETALYHAASNGNYEVVKILAGLPLADVNLKNKVSTGMGLHLITCSTLMPTINSHS